MIIFFRKIRKKCIQKARSRRGFSLAEMLVTLMIIGLVTAAIAGGAGVVQNVYRNITVKANAEVAESTAIKALQGYMRYAGSYAAGTSGGGTFVDVNTGYRMRIYNDTQAGRVYVQYYMLNGKPGSTASGMTQPLIPDAAFGTTLGSDLEMYMVPYSSIEDTATADSYKKGPLSYVPAMDADGNFSFGLVVLRGDTVMAQEKVTIHSLNAGS